MLLPSLSSAALVAAVLAALVIKWCRGVGHAYKDPYLRPLLSSFPHLLLNPCECCGVAIQLSFVVTRGVGGG